MKLVIDTQTNHSGAGNVRYNDFEHATISDIATYLEGSDVDAILMRNVVSPIYFNVPTYILDLKSIDPVAMRDIRSLSPHIDKLVGDMYRRFIDPTTPMLPPHHETEQVITAVRTDPDKYCITTKNINLITALYGLTRSRTVIEYKTPYNHKLYGDRLQYSAVSNLMRVCNAMKIPIDVERAGVVYAVTDMGEIEHIASTFSLCDRGVDIRPDTLTIGNGYQTPWDHVKHITHHLSECIRDPAYKDALFVFNTKSMAAFQIRMKARNTHIKFDGDRVSWYGGHGVYDHAHDAVVLVGVPRINPTTAFITDPDQTMGVYRYRRFHLLNAIGQAKRVRCVGISPLHLGRLLGDIPGIIVGDPAR